MRKTFSIMAKCWAASTVPPTLANHHVLLSSIEWALRSLQKVEFYLVDGMCCVSVAKQVVSLLKHDRLAQTDQKFFLDFWFFLSVNVLCDLKWSLQAWNFKKCQCFNKSFSLEQHWAINKLYVLLSGFIISIAHILQCCNSLISCDWWEAQLPMSG